MRGFILIVTAMLMVLFAISSMPVQAREITVYTRPIVATANASAQDYLNNWNAALAANQVAPPGYGEAVITKFDEVQTHAVIDGGTTTSISVFYNIDFFIPASLGANWWKFRFTVDFGLGGAVFLDGKAIAFSNTDLQGSDNIKFRRYLRPGAHYIRIYEQENCCDGFSYWQVQPPGGPPLIGYHIGNFSLTDGWSLK